MDRKNTCNEIAGEYDKYRPSYPDVSFIKWGISLKEGFTLRD
ncbi:hypothetical protein [Paenibacillus roseipurpureus]|uniref:Uncharacterized protein n=1 Tax=Paenibacillus roseopurpureus TaxID=2918901 RepID=A0AA96LVJ9_9BACL|nr:hypothetical protein [Paenibacillus sp. MBLB1832]WNR46888.1 hypothetical protein MJB10_12610 [Paenibacillus sp. MBLB1832]